MWIIIIIQQPCLPGGVDRSALKFEIFYRPIVTD